MSAPNQLMGIGWASDTAMPNLEAVLLYPCLRCSTEDHEKLVRVPEGEDPAGYFDPACGGPISRDVRVQFLREPEAS